MDILLIIGILAIVTLTILMCLQESKKRKINFYVALLICIITTPFIGYFILSSIGLRNPKGCKWFGNKENEVEYCGICGKNEEGFARMENKLPGGE